MALVTLQMIFQDAFPAYAQTHPLPAHIRRAARAAMQCRTAVLGGHVQACPDGHMARIWYNSCRHRACPQCASLQTERWLTLQQARLLACDHYHVIFTLPHDLNPLWLANVSVMTTLLFQAVHDTLRTLLADPKYLGAQPGILAALHTWSQTLVLHPHVHCLVTGGGRTADGSWEAVRTGFLLPVRVVMAGVPGELLAPVRPAPARAGLAVPAGGRPPPELHPLPRGGAPQEAKRERPVPGGLPAGGGGGPLPAPLRAGGPAKDRPPHRLRGGRGPLPVPRPPRGGGRGPALSAASDLVRGRLSP